MSDDFGTVNVGKGDRAREIEILRQRYRRNRDALQRLIPDAPTEHLSYAYEQLTVEIDDALRKLDEMEGRAPTEAEMAAAAATAGARSRTMAGDRPLERVRESAEDAPPSQGAGGRVAMIVIAGALVLAVIVYLMWHGAETKNAPTTPTPVVETTAPADTAAPSTVAPIAPVTETRPVAAAVSIKVAPAITDYGVIRKGTRAVRQFDVTNNGSEPVTIQVSRSACRCLYYDYHDKVAPKKKETITVAVDGARAKAGPLHETVTVTTREDQSVSGQFVVQATIK